MNPKKYKMIINTTGMTLKDIPVMLKAIEASFVKGYVNGTGWNEIEKKEYSFKTTEM